MVVAIVSEADQAEILSYIDGLPPSEFLDQCSTSDRKKHWHECKRTQQELHASLKAWFSGEPEPVNLIRPCRREIIRMARNRYLYLYALIQEGWDEIKQYAEEVGYPNFPGSPKSTFLSIVDKEAAGHFAEAYPELVTGNFYQEYSPGKEYKLFQDSKKLRAGKIKNQLKIDRIKKDLNSTARMRWRWMFHQLQDICIQACREKARRGSDLELRLREYENYEERFAMKIMTQARPGNRPQGFSWKKGERNISKRGGAYVS